MNEEEILSLNTYIENLYQAMQIGDIKFEPKHSSELYNLINKLLKENQQLKEQLKQNFNTDYTSTYIYCEEQVKDRIKVLEQKNKQLKEQKRLILKNVKEWIRCSKCEQLEPDLVHEKYWNSFEQILRNIFKNYNTENLSDNDLKYKHYLEKENEELQEQLKQKEDIINKAKEYIENNPLYDIDVYEYSICLNGIDDEQTRKELLEILDNKGDENDG